MNGWACRPGRIEAGPPLEASRNRQRNRVVTALLQIVILLAAAVLVSVSLDAHEGHSHHLMGTVTALEEGTITVKATDGTIVLLSLTANTVYRQGQAARSRADLAVGDRVVIELTIDGVMQSPDGARGVAKEIRFARTGESQ